MKTMSKRLKEAHTLVDHDKEYSLDEAVQSITQFPVVKFDETVEIHLKLNIDTKASEQMVRGTVTLPHGSGKKIKIAVFCKGTLETTAKNAGADHVGNEELIKKVEEGFLDFDVVIASPDAMRVVGQLGQILGPRGLMPNPKTGTVTPDVATAVKNAKAGQIRFRIDKNGIIHGGIGKLDFDVNALKENLEALLVDLKKAQPAAAKGIYLKKVVLSTTMGPGLVVDMSTLEY